MTFTTAVSARFGIRPPVVIVGAGPQALTIAAHLVGHGRIEPEELTVIDPSGDWLAGWRRSFAAFEIEHLRSPAVHHPHPDPYALLKFARSERRNAELIGRYQAPTTQLFDDFCEHVIDRFELAERVLEGRVDQVTPDGRVRWCSTTGPGTEACASSTTWVNSVVLAHQPRSRVMPDLPAGLTARVHHAETVDVDCVTEGERVAVIGGGLTAGHLACAAARRGASVRLLARRPIVEREFDTDPGWLGPREMRGYLRIESLATRARVAREARGGGSMPSWMLRRLDELRSRGILTIAADADPLDISRHVRPDEHLWCATGWATDPRCDPVLGHLLEVTGNTLVDHLIDLGPRLEVPGSCVHVVGRPAALRLGPTGGNLAGARRAFSLMTGADPDAIG